MAMSRSNAGSSPAGALWLVVNHDARAHVFELAADAERAVVVGSLNHADVRIEGPAIAPVHFHFERDGQRLLLVPAYNAEVRVNSRLARGPLPISDHAMVEFAGVRLEAAIHFTRPDYTPLPSLDILERESGIQYLSSLPSDTQTTKLALEASPHVANVQAGIDTHELTLEQASQGTHTLRIERVDPALQTTQLMERLQVAAAPLPVITQQTRRMERVAPETFFSPKAERTPVMEVRPVRAVPAAAMVAEPRAEAPPPEVPSSPAQLGWQETTAFDLDDLKADLAARAAAGAAPPAQPPEPKLNAPTAPPRPAPPVVRKMRALARRAPVRVVERVGSYAKAHPVAAGASALGAAVALALVMVGVSHVLAEPSGPRPTVARTGETPTIPTASAATSTLVPGPELAALKLAETPSVPPASEQAALTSPAVASVVPAAAAGHLVAGRYVEARAAYRALAAAQPANPVYLAVARLLEKRTSGICSGSDAAASCPEIMP